MKKLVVLFVVVVFSANLFAQAQPQKKVASFIKKGLEEEYYQIDTASNGKIAL